MTEALKFADLSVECAVQLFSKSLWKQEEAVLTANGVKYALFVENRDKFWRLCADSLKRKIRHELETLSIAIKMRTQLRVFADTNFPNDPDRARVAPNDFLAWAYEIGFDLNTVVFEAKTQFDDETAKRKLTNPFRDEVNWQQRYDGVVVENRSLKALLEKLDTENKLNPKTKSSMQKLIAGMAIAGYSFDPNAARNATTKDIDDDLTRLGIGLSRDVILEQIREAIAETSPTVEPKN